MVTPREIKKDEQRAARRGQAEAARQRAQARGETSAVRLPTEGLSTPTILRATIDKIHEMAPRCQIQPRYAFRSRCS